MTNLPINTDELLSGHVIEWERLEFKEGWNPEDILHSICAFANDVNNWGGGYIVIGVEEQNGLPLLPPKGLKPNQVDSIQKKILELGNRLRPSYRPVTVPVTYLGKLIIILWCPGGPTRPYLAPKTLADNAPYHAYIRRNSCSIKARSEDERRLYELANQVPFDDRIHHQADLKDLDIGLIKTFLSEVKSDLLDDVDRISFKRLCQQMRISQGPPEYLKPLNIGLLMFNKDPEKFFPYARIEIVEFHDEVGDSFSEKIFKGPIHLQLQESLRYLQSTLLREEVRKHSDRAEADRFFNYPYTAVKEALSNAVYHKDYSLREPIEVRIHPNRIEILSFPGPMPPLRIDDLNKGQVAVRHYRNRRIGDFLKELHLTEGRCTGVPKIRKAMENNGSPLPSFQTDPEELSFLVTLPVHNHTTPKNKLKEDKDIRLEPQTHQLEPQTHQLEPQTHQLEPQTHQLATHLFENLPADLQKSVKALSHRPTRAALEIIIKALCRWHSLTAQEIAAILERKDKKHLVRAYLTPMVEAKKLTYVYPEELVSPRQAYKARQGKHGK